MKTPLLTLIAILFYQSLTHANYSKNKCEEVLTGNDVIQVNRQWNEASRNCFISVTPRNIVDLKYRDYYFDSSGEFMVFNSYGIGSDAEMTGSRVYYIYPVVEEYPDYSFETNGDVTVKLASGHLFRISGKDFSILSLSDAKIKEGPLSKKNAGGVEIELLKGFWLDAGFKLGGTGLDSPSKKSLFKAASAKPTCSLINNSFLNYQSDGNYNLKYTGNALLQFLKTKCPQLKL